MRIAYLDCFSGISGDMFLGALVDAGVSPRLLEETVAALDLGARLGISRVSRNGIAATKVDVWVGGEKDRPRTELSHAHHHGAHHHHDHDHPATPAEPHRGLKEIREIIERAPIDAAAKETALAIFEALGAAEAKIHGVEVEKVHFHEVGAVDAIVDIVCAAVASRALGVDEWVCSPLNLGSGTVACAHGNFPVPAPATAELLKDAPVFSSGIEAELVTPTGAAIVKALASRFVSLPPMKIKSVGYGAGSRDFERHANVLRVLVGERVEAETQHAASLHEGSQKETITVLEANLDDLNPQVFGYVLDRLLAEGALDVFATPVQMKKSRPGLLLTVLAKPEDAPRLMQMIFAETTTLGIRLREERRQTLVRRSVSVATPWGEVRMKVASLNGTVANYAPEYEDCRHIAEQHRVPLKQVMQEALRLYLQEQHG
jgi:hypothetical protein